LTIRRLHIYLRIIKKIIKLENGEKNFFVRKQKTKKYSFLFKKRKTKQKLQNREQKISFFCFETEYKIVYNKGQLFKYFKQQLLITIVWKKFKQFYEILGHAHLLMEDEFTFIVVM